jgi:hypothetical protein
MRSFFDCVERRAGAICQQIENESFDAISVKTGDFTVSVVCAGHFQPRRVADP